jgi:hypothetical protein
MCFLLLNISDTVNSTIDFIQSKVLDIDKEISIIILLDIVSRQGIVPYLSILLLPTPKFIMLQIWNFSKYVKNILIIVR